MAELVGAIGTFMMADIDVIREVDQNVLLEDLDFSPLATFMSRIQGTEQVHNTKFEWQENIIDKFAVTCGAIGATSAGVETADIVFQSANMRTGDVVFHPGSGQKWRLTTFTSSDSTTWTGKMTRIPFASAGSAVTGTPTLRVLGNHTLEKGWFPAGVGTKPQWYSNYTQPFGTVAEITWEMKETATYHGSQFEQDNMYAWQNLQGGQERTILFGEAINENQSWTDENGNVNSGVARQTQGLFKWITSVGPYSGDLDKATLNAFTYGRVWASRNSGSRKKMAVTGINVFEAIDDMANNQLRLFPGAAELGLDIYEVKVAGSRSLALVEEREFMNDLNASEYADTMMVIEPNMITLCQLGNYFIKIGKLPEERRPMDGIYYWSNLGLKFKGRNKHHLLTKVPS